MSANMPNNRAEAAIGYLQATSPDLALHIQDMPTETIDDQLMIAERLDILLEPESRRKMSTDDLKAASVASGIVDCLRTVQLEDIDWRNTTAVERLVRGMSRGSLGVYCA